MSQIIVKNNPAPSELDAINVKKWPTWEKEVSIFDWHFPEQEIAYIIAGECVITPIDQQGNAGTPVAFGAGDLVTFPAGLSAKWEVKQALHKHYKLDGNVLTQAFLRIKAKFFHS
jgi:uncharacterized protein